MAERLTEFDYLLNRFERASQADKPAELEYGKHRREFYAYVRKLEAVAAEPAEQPLNHPAVPASEEKKP